ncbi:putative non-specific serine/threonine protein kinase [Helianthus annuus]|nr:putative non-specific serine/threonine protein kinase [Helianthus annuus]
MASIAESVSVSLFFLLHLLSITATVAQTTYPSDVSALKAIKVAIDPTTIPDYSCLATWDFTYDPYTTPSSHFLCGCACVYDYRINMLYFDAISYVGTLSPLVSELTGLESIDLSNNKFSGPIPTSLFSLPNLISLNLRNNSFSGTIPPIIPILGTLQILDLSSNLLSGPLPQTLSSRILIHLDLSFNNFRGPIPKLPRNVRELALKSNYLSGILPETSFSELVQLEAVDLSDNLLTGTIPGWFFLQPFLQRVNLSNNRFTGMEILKPNNSNFLDTIDAGYNKINGYLSTNFTVYHMLSSLSLRYNKLKGSIPKEFSRKTTLRTFFLDGNYLKGKPSKDFFSWKSSIVSGSFGDNFLKRCPKSSKLCSKSQKSSSICRNAYDGKVKV